MQQSPQKEALSELGAFNLPILTYGAKHTQHNIKTKGFRDS